MGYLLIAALIVYCIFSIISYRKTSYYKITHNSILSVLFDKGRLGEYRIYKYLRNQEKNGARFLFNAYLPKSGGETTEIDVMLIHKDGIFVFESKNYSGWIFGGETQRNWTQCLPKGRGKPSQKEHFLNPIFQNKLHISALKRIIGEKVPFYSIVTFSERCTLKDISVSDPMVRVINRNQVSNAIPYFSSIATASAQLSQADIDKIYEALFPFTQVSDEVKERHIRAIQYNDSEMRSEISVDADVASPIPNRSEKDEAAQNPSHSGMICPLCGGTLVLRTSTRGENKGKQFYGCSNYPRCHYIRNI